MDRRLIEAAQRGDVNSLLNLIENEPLILEMVELSGGETPLHVASTAGQLDFVKRILRLKKEFAAQLNQDGLSPLHIASANGDIEIVKELLEADNRVCILKGREGMIPLHYAAINGRILVIRELLLACADSVEDATARGETALHLALKNNQFEAFKVLVEHLKKFKKEHVLNKQEERTHNTVLHLAVSRKQYEVIDFMFKEHNFREGVVDLNSKNKRGLTALDVLLCFQCEARDREIEDILVKAGAMRPPGIQWFRSLTNNTYLNHFKYRKERDKPSDVRNCLLVVATLIATATYQAVLNPRGGVWSDDSSGNNNTKPHFAGQAIMQSYNPWAYGLLLVFNTMGFTLSIYMIQVLTIGFPMQLELTASLHALLLTYDISMVVLSPKTKTEISFAVFAIISQFIWPSLVALVRCALRCALRRLTSSLEDRQQGFYAALLASTFLGESLSGFY